MRITNIPFIVCTAGLFTVACAHRRPVLPDEKSVTVAREAAPKACREIGPIEGRVAHQSDTRAQALEDLKREATNRGGNYVVVQTWSTLGTAVTGVAYACP